MRSLPFILIFLCAGFPGFSQSLSNDTLHWAEHRTLHWEDFRGDTIDVPALTGQAMMVMLAKFRKIHLFLPATTHVVAVFDRKNSWNVTRDRTATSLLYHQVSFDIYELYSRKLRKEFKETKFGLDPNKVFDQKYSEALNDLSDRSKQFMKETKMGTDSAALHRWDTLIHDELKELEDYRSK